MTDAKPKRRWITFSLRTLLIVMTLLCVGIGWKMNKVGNWRRAVAEAQRLGATITYFHDLDATTSPAEPPGPKWLRRIFGDDFFEEVSQIQIYNDQANDD